MSLIGPLGWAGMGLCLMAGMLVGVIVRKDISKHDQDELDAWRDVGREVGCATPKAWKDQTTLLKRVSQTQYRRNT